MYFCEYFFPHCLSHNINNEATHTSKKDTIVTRHTSKQGSEMLKILIVDDDASITDLMKALLKMEGHDAITVNDSLAAMDIAKSVNPDLITLDLMMPGLTGFELCQMFSEDPTFSKTPIIIISAKDDSESRKQAFDAGAKDYIIKPFLVDDFIGKIESLTLP